MHDGMISRRGVLKTLAGLGTLLGTGQAFSAPNGSQVLWMPDHQIAAKTRVISEEALLLTVSREHGSELMLQFRFSSEGGLLKWVPVPGDEIYITPDGRLVEVYAGAVVHEKGKYREFLQSSTGRKEEIQYTR